jgi:hypothetical protein
MESTNLEATVEFIQMHKLEDEVDLVTCDTVDTYMTEGAWEWGFKSYENFKNAGGDVSNIKVHSGDEAKKVRWFYSLRSVSLLTQYLSSSECLR